MIMLCHTLQPHVPRTTHWAVQRAKVVKDASNVVWDVFEDGGRLKG